MTVVPEGAESGAARAQLEALRASCEAPGGGCTVMQAVGLCASHALPLPAWLAVCFIRMRALVAEAHVATWDEAIGRPWPAHVRLASIRRRMVLKRRIHSLVWDSVRADRDTPINRLLFDAIGERPEIAVSGSMAERLYYEAVSEGSLSVATWRRASRQADEGESSALAKLRRMA